MITMLVGGADNPTTRVTSKRFEQAIDDHPTSWKTKQEHRETKRGTLEWCLLARPSNQEVSRR